MIGTLLLASTLAMAPSQSGGLSLNNPRLTYRELGPVRTETKFLPGDFVFLAFDIEGLKMNEEGRVVYTMGMEVIDQTGKAIFSAPPAKSEMVLPLGGTKLPGHVYVSVGPEMVAGNYTAKVTVVDTANPAVSKSIEQKFQVLPMGFGLVALYVSLDDRAMFPCGMTGVAGQTVFVNFGLVGFGRDATKKPDAAVEFRVLDETGKATVAKSIVIAVPKELPEKEQFVPFQVPLALNREGSFTVEIKAKDTATGKTAALTFPIKIHPASK